MCNGSYYGEVSSASIAKGAKEYFSDDGSRDYGEGGATGGVIPLTEKSRYQRMRCGMY